jgi:hypothetical protein
VGEVQGQGRPAGPHSAVAPGVLTARQVIAVAYALLVEDADKRWHIRALLAGQAIVAGAKEVEIPELDDVRADLDAALAAPLENEQPARPDDRQQALRVLGIT